MRAAVWMLLVGQVLVLIMMANDLFALHVGRELVAGALAAAPGASGADARSELARHVSQAQLSTMLLFYTGGVGLLLGAVLTVRATRRGKLLWSRGAAALILLGTLLVAVGAFVLPYVLAPASPLPVGGLHEDVARRLGALLEAKYRISWICSLVTLVGVALSAVAAFRVRIAPAAPDSV